MAKLPLKTRKSIKTAIEKAEASMKKASAAFGKELSLVDNTSELYEKLVAASWSESQLFEIGDSFGPYFEQFAKTMTEFCKNPDNKEQLEVELTTGKVGVRLVENNEKWWVLDEGVLWMEASSYQFGTSYLTNYDVARLANILGKADSMPLNTRKSIKDAQAKIDKAIAAASKSFGKELSWVDNYQELYDKLKKESWQDSNLFELGNYVVYYPEQLAKTFEKFCKDTDNREALEEVLTSGKVGVRLVETNEKWWSLVDGCLWMDAVAYQFGSSYISNYDAEKLERIL